MEYPWSKVLGYRALGVGIVFERVEHNPSAFCSFSFKNLHGVLATISEANFYSLDSVERKSVGAHISVSFPECVLISGV